MVPNGWEVTFLKDITLKIQDGNYGADYPKKNELVNSGIPFLTSKVLGGDGKINENKFDYITPEKHGKLKKAQITKDDVLFTNRGANVGVIGLADEKLMNANIGPQLTLIRADRKRLESKFLYFALKGDYFQRQIKGQDSGSAMNFFGIKTTEKFKVPVPPLPEQRKIAQILSTWDRGIATTEKLIDASKQQKRALMQQLLTGKKRLVDPEMGKAFEGDWEEVKLKEITQFIKDGTHGTHKRYDKGVPMLSAVNITKNHKVNFNGAPNISHDDYNKIHSKYEIDEGDILLTVVGTIGRVALVPKAMKFTLQRSVAIIRTSNKASNQFLMQVFSSNEFNNLLMSKSNSTAQAGVYLGELAKIKLLLPLLEEQEKIASVLTAADKDIELLNAKLTHLKQEKKALMQQLLTGKRRVSLSS